MHCVVSLHTSKYFTVLYLQLLQKSQAIAVKQKQICTLAGGLKDQEVLPFAAKYVAVLFHCIAEDSAKGAW